MVSGFGFFDRRLVLEVSGAVAIGFSALQLGRLWLQARRMHAQHRQQLIRGLYNDPGGVVRQQKREGP